MKQRTARSEKGTFYPFQKDFVLVVCPYLTGETACFLLRFSYNDCGLRFDQLLGSTEVREYSRFFLSQTLTQNVLHIYVDELGDVGPFDPKSPIYLVGLVMANQDVDKNRGLHYFKNLEKRYGPNNFIHTGNLIRGEEPYEGILLGNRQKLLWSFINYAANLDIRFRNVVVDKSTLKNQHELANSLRKALVGFLDQNMDYFINYDLIVVHYDGGQKLCTQTLQKAFLSRFDRVLFEKTLQFDDILMQVADLICVLGNLEYKLIHGNLSHSEEIFLGKRRMVKKEILGRFKKKKI